MLSTLKKLSKSPLPFNSCIILENKGVIIRNDALKGTLEIIRYACNLISLIPDHADLKYLNESEASAFEIGSRNIIDKVKINQNYEKK